MRAFLIEMSTGSKIPIDEEEVELITQSIRSGKVVKVKRGIINPSYITSVVEDVKRMQDVRVYSDGSSSGFAKLENLFDGIKKISSEFKIEERTRELK